MLESFGHWCSGSYNLSHEVLRIFLKNFGQPKISLAWILTCDSKLKTWTSQINLLFSINILFTDWYLPMVVNFSEFLHILSGPQESLALCSLTIWLTIHISGFPTETKKPEKGKNKRKSIGVHVEKEEEAEGEYA